MLFLHNAPHRSLIVSLMLARQLALIEPRLMKYFRHYVTKKLPTEPIERDTEGLNVICYFYCYPHQCWYQCCYRYLYHYTRYTVIISILVRLHFVCVDSMPTEQSIITLNAVKLYLRVCFSDTEHPVTWSLRLMLSFVCSLIFSRPPSLAHSKWQINFQQCQLRLSSVQLAPAHS